jgi:hypothetical protein
VEGTRHHGFETPPACRCSAQSWTPGVSSDRRRNDCAGFTSTGGQVHTVYYVLGQDDGSRGSARGRTLCSWPMSGEYRRRTLCISQPADAHMLLRPGPSPSDSARPSRGHNVIPNRMSGLGSTCSPQHAPNRSPVPGGAINHYDKRRRYGKHVRRSPSGHWSLAAPSPLHGAGGGSRQWYLIGVLATQQTCT